jgi:CheY-like chemotaxis protein
MSKSLFTPKKVMSKIRGINILMADDDEDDRYFFKKALEKLSISTNLVTVEDGEELIDYLTKDKGKIPDILFLDINMPRKNGYESLIEIKSNKDIRDFPIIMYSTSLRDSMADTLFQNGAHYYLRKGDSKDLEKHLEQILTLLVENNLKRQVREEFFLNEMRII